MRIRSLPPGRRSSEHSGVVNPCGPHHFARCRGSVHTLNTSARGASRTRVRSSSRGAWVDLDVIAVALFALNLMEIGGEAVDSLIPNLAVRFDPVRDVNQRLGT